MVRLVDDLLDISRIARNKIELRVEKLDLASILAQAVECARPALSSLQHEIHVAAPDEPIYVDGDPVRLTQVFANLLDNACKYMDRGGRIVVATEIGPERHDGRHEVIVRVRDEGVGIAADQLDRIFELFTQIDASLERSRSGLGIGLTLVTSLVELHGGRVEAHSAGPGRGSEFSVILPRAAGESRERPLPETEAAPRNRYRILVVDDNRDSAQSLAAVLQLMGHETHTAFDGAQAVAAAGSIGPDAVLLDLGMPVLNGYDACREIRKQPWSKQMILIAQTGWGQDEDRRRTEEVGFDGHLVKPINPEALLKMLSARPTGKD
jgi:CheY-like chemotaxis protein/two-component sensor histidine kinase